jgi:hypothetical protein
LPAEPEAPKFEPSERYETREIEGWPVRVHCGLLETEPELADRTLGLLRIQLYQITRVVPAEPLGKMRKIAIWVEEKEPHHPCMAYHPDAGWLREHDMNPDKARCVELANSRNFLRWTIDQPWMVLHELAHGYHHQFLNEGFDNPEVLAVYKQSRAEKRYDAVLRINGKREKHYAATNQMECFAEATEAYFGTNDFFPYVRSELHEHDPALFELLEKLWGQPVR